MQASAPPDPSPDAVSDSPFMNKILILTAAFGEGHNAAARGLQSALLQQPDVSATVIDPFPDAYPTIYEPTRRGYLKAIDRHPRIWGVVYHLFDRSPLVFVIESLLSRLHRRLAEIVKEHQPDAIISTYPVFGYTLNRIFPRLRGRPFRQFTIVTDSITVNSAWHRCETDLFFVPNADTAAVMKAAGVSEDKLCVLGFPVPPLFAQERPPRPAPGAGTPGRVLYMVNAGWDRAVAVVEQLLKIEGIALTVTVGRSDSLRAKVEEVVRRSGKTVEIYGWTPKMPELIMSHHVLIGKAGGAAVQEAIAAQTPVIITSVVPGQEEGNAQLLTQHGCGAVQETPAAIAGQIEALFADNGALWRQWEARMKELSRPSGAVDIAARVLQEIKRNGAS
jgi:processive 1,2-diacylglycerol beta-glucosyltransferase